jgi:hypothetical protein
MKIINVSATSKYLKLKHNATKPVIPTDVKRMIPIAKTILLDTVGNDVKRYRKGVAINKAGLEKKRLRNTAATSGKNNSPSP